MDRNSSLALPPTVPKPVGATNVCVRASTAYTMKMQMDTASQRICPQHNPLLMPGKASQFDCRPTCRPICLRKAAATSTSIATTTAPMRSMLRRHATCMNIKTETAQTSNIMHSMPPTSAPLVTGLSKTYAVASKPSTTRSGPCPESLPGTLDEHFAFASKW